MSSGEFFFDDLIKSVWICKILAFLCQVSIFNNHNNVLFLGWNNHLTSLDLCSSFLSLVTTAPGDVPVSDSVPVHTMAGVLIVTKKMQKKVRKGTNNSNIINTNK